jgi:NAD(P)-dependent dehydrogenase (short-subunit alcohol dehydrogenase family)
MRYSAKTIVVTGASSGIGKATARLFAERGWNVVAAMRQPEAEKDLVEGDRLKLMPIDVQDPASVRAAVAAAVAEFGTIDVWLNNAGYGAFGPVEAGSRAQIQRQFDVNVFGMIECVQAIAPHFRANRGGVLINVSSTGGLATAPGYSVYNSSKFAVEGVSEGLWYELGAFGVKVKLIEPGVIKTDFGGRSMDVWDLSNLPDYTGLMEKVRAARERFTRNPSAPELVAATIFKAANDPGDRLRYLVGADAKRLWRVRRWLGYRTQMRIVRRASGLALLRGTASTA